MSRDVARRRALALAEAVERIEAEFGTLGDMIVGRTGLEPAVAINEGVPYGFPDDQLANSVRLDPWEIVLLLQALRDRYASDVLGPLEVSRVPGPEGVGR